MDQALLGNMELVGDNALYHNIDEGHFHHSTRQPSSFSCAEIQRTRPDQPTQLKVGDPDAFFASLYKFYNSKGLRGLIMIQVCAILSLGFTVCFSSLLLCFMNWRQLLHECGSVQNYSEDSSDTSTPEKPVTICRSLESYVITSPVETFSNNRVKLFFILLYPALMLAFWLWRVAHAVVAIRQGVLMNFFFASVLVVSPEQLKVMSWGNVIARLKEACVRGTVHLRCDGRAEGIGEEGLEMEASLRLLRKENYLIALVSAGVIDCPLQCAGVNALLGAHHITPGKAFLSPTMEWAITFCVLEHMLTEPPGAGAPLLSVTAEEDDSIDLECDDHQYQDWTTHLQEQGDTGQQENHFHLRVTGAGIRRGEPRVSQAFLSDWVSLQLRLRVVGGVLLILLPFTLAYNCLHFFLRNAQLFRSAGAYLGPRRWSPVALWAFREYNELPRDFEVRMARASKPASSYLDSFPAPVLAALAHCAAYIAGAVAATLLALSFVAESALLRAQVGEHNLLWWLAICTSTYAAARSLIPTEELLLVLPLRVELLACVSKETHYYSPYWPAMPLEQRGTEAGPAHSFKGAGAVKTTTTHGYSGPGAQLGTEAQIKTNSDSNVNGDVDNDNTDEDDYGIGGSEDEVNQAEAQLLARAELAALFPHQVMLFLAELVSTILTPFTLLLVLSNETRCSRFLSFLRAHTRHVHGIGAVCAPALFDFNRYASHAAAGKVNPEQYPMNTSRDAFEARGARNGSMADISIRDRKRQQSTATSQKMEASFLSFVRRNPKWRQGPLQQGGQQLLEGLKGLRMCTKLHNGVNDALKPAGASGAYKDKDSTKCISSSKAKKLPQVLQSVLRQQGLDWEGDHYWLERFRHTGGAENEQISRPGEFGAREATAAAAEQGGNSEESSDSSLGIYEEDKGGGKEEKRGGGTGTRLTWRALASV